MSHENDPAFHVPNAELHESEPVGVVAYVFPGQGIQKVGMGEDLYNKYSLVREVYKQANEILGYSLSDISFYDSHSQLNKTEYAQPAIFVHSHASFLLGRQSKPVDFVAGNSLGEYNALVATGAFSFEDGLKLVQARAIGMQEACSVNPSEMLAVLNANPEKIEELLRKFTVSVALFNTKTQLVIGGSPSDIENARLWLKSERLGAKKLNTKGAFHTPFMEPAIPYLEKVLKSIDICVANIPVIANTTAKPIQNSSEIKQELLGQLTSAVNWQGIIEYMNRGGLTDAYEYGVVEKPILSSMIAATMGGSIENQKSDFAVASWHSS